MGHAAEGGDEVAVAQLALLEVFAVEAEGDFGLGHDLVSGNPCAEDVVLPLGSGLP